LKDAIAAVISVDPGIAFDAPDGQAVRLLVFLLVPENANEQHLEILSELAELLSDASLRTTLMQAQDATEVHHLLADWEPYRPAA
jgi:PTS system nitrogen regulatory IIA component